MVRKKVKLQYIEDDTIRRATFKKRVKSVHRKTQELCVLSDINTCSIAYGIYDRALIVWPSIRQKLARFQWSLGGNPILTNPKIADHRHISEAKCDQVSGIVGEAKKEELRTLDGEHLE
ncbi:hypothetical protein RND81_12G078000 [Saponaria officinalis]|uniref:MADS-box domain-containing protein n=1 Tax=Saponaria officinalis TaxID=3572 RepID=A0AAW1H7U6_SAPOF